jgi:hypothetical protein
VLFKGRATIENALLGAVSEEADGAAARTNIEDAGGSSTWLQPLEMLLHKAPDLDLNVSIECTCPTPRAPSDVIFAPATRV